MAWETKYPKYGKAEVKGKNVRALCNKFNGTTIEVGEEVTKAVWEGSNLCITLKNGQVRKYSSKFDFTTA